MKPVPKEYTPSTTDDFAPVPDGTYQALSLTIFSVDDNTNKPILKQQKNGNMVAYANFICDQHEPPISFSLGEAKAIVFAFGGDLNALPAVPPLNDIQGVSVYLEAVETLCANGTKNPKVKVYNGWVNLPSVEGSYPPNGIYTWTVTDIRGEGEGITLLPRQGQYGPFFYITVRLLGSAAGQTDPLSGLEYASLVSYKVEVGADGKPDWTRSKKDNEYTTTSKALSDFVGLTGPTFFSGPEAQNAHSILPEYLAAILADRVPFVCYGGTNDKGRWSLSIDTATASGASTIQVVNLPPDPTSTNNTGGTDHQRIILELFNSLGKNKDIAVVFESPESLEVASTGIPLLVQYITPLKESGVLPKTVGHLAELSPEQVTLILQNIDKSDLDEETISLINKELGITDATKQPLF